MKRILVLHTGGTIAMEEDKETGVVQPGEKNPLLKFIPDLEGDVDLIVEDVFHLPSPHMTPSEML
ncbi:asparaginase, partial [Acinetobacter baumannii]|nr:asparaginase [Acinetobacter baumannii]